jgi:hypothetical protein
VIQGVGTVANHNWTAVAFDPAADVVSTGARKQAEALLPDDANCL